jgi:hypothetical protein
MSSIEEQLLELEARVQQAILMFAVAQETIEGYLARAEGAAARAELANVASTSALEANETLLEANETLLEANVLVTEVATLALTEEVIEPTEEEEEEEESIDAKEKPSTPEMDIRDTTQREKKEEGSKPQLEPIAIDPGSRGKTYSNKTPRDSRYHFRRGTQRRAQTD